MSVEAPKLDVKSIVEQLDKYSVEELWTLEEQIVQRLRQRTVSSNGNGYTEPTMNFEPDMSMLMPKSTSEEDETELREIFGDDLDRIKKIDTSNLPPLPKTLAEYISEDREDRF